MKLLLLASFALLCTASTVYKSKNISVEDDGSILITTPTGKRVAITRDSGLNGQRNIDIAVSGPNIPTKRIQIDDSVQGGYLPNQWAGEETRLKRGSSSKSKSQGDVLSEILKEFQGGVNEAQYEKLLAKISGAVRLGEVSPQVYDLLQGFDQQQGVWGQNQGLYGLFGRYGINGYQNQLYTPYVNPLYSSGLYGGLGYQYLPQGSSLSRILSVNPLLKQIVQQPIQTIQQAEQTIQQLEVVQQQLQQNIQNIEQLYQIQQQQGGVSGVEQAIEQQQIAQLSEVQQVVQQLEQQQVGQLVGAIQQLQQQQLSVPQFQGQLSVQQALPQLQGQIFGVPQQFAGVQGQYGIQQLSPQQQQLLLNQIPQIQQSLRQVYGIPQSYVQQPISGQRLISGPLSLQQLIGVPQVGQSRFASSGSVSGRSQGLNSVPQVVF